MTIANCKRCGRMYNRIRRDICPPCVEDEEKAFQTVRTYLREHRDATMDGLVEATGVDMQLIVDMIRDGRLILRDNPNLTYQCERCGQPTQSGRYCAACTKELAAGLGDAATEMRRQRDTRSQNDKASGGGFYSRK